MIENPNNPQTPQEQEAMTLARQEAEAAGIRAMRDLVGEVKSGVLESQREQGEREMQIARLRADFAKGFINKFFWFLMTIIAIAAIAVFTDRADIGSQIIFAVLGFVGGAGFGMFQRK